MSAIDGASRSPALRRFFDEAFDERVSRSPQMLARLGVARRQTSSMTCPMTPTKPAAR